MLAKHSLLDEWHRCLKMPVRHSSSEIPWWIFKQFHTSSFVSMSSGVPGTSLVVAQSITACLFKAVTFFRKIPWYPTFLEFNLITETLANFFMANPKSEKKLARSSIEMNGNPLWNADQMSFFEVDFSSPYQHKHFPLSIPPQLVA